MSNAAEYGKKSLQARVEKGGLMELSTKVSITTPDELATFYTPGVGHMCQVLADAPERTRELTIAKDTVAIISDGTAVLGFGDLGPRAVLPVLEGKAIILKQFSGINAFPILLDTTDTEEIIRTIKNIAPGFGGIFLEDISAPRCFEIEDRLSEMLDIPVFHDDQHGTAIVVLGALMNAVKLTSRTKENLKVVINGAGAAGIAIAKILQNWGGPQITLCDSRGVVYTGRENVNAQKAPFATETDKRTLADAVAGADVFIGVSKKDVLSEAMVATMATDAIVFALANPHPEILPPVAHAAGAAITATGRSDFNNQINNALVFPGIFKGLLDNKIPAVTPEIRIGAAQALADMVANPTPEKILPGVFDAGLTEAIADAVAKAA